jgi:DNA (cytosine-5)-methyltransferase 1
VIRYGSVCSGIEAASVAWHVLGWKPQWFSEIEAFPSAVLACRWPGVPNLGDLTKIGGDVATIDLLVGGTPCQSFSVAGLRGGLADERGNLALEFLRLAQRTRARWLVWENVPGVLSSNGGGDFGSILGGMVELGYGFAYRILDAQYFGVPQRRRRVFVVGHLGDWRPAAAVLFERESLRRNPAPSRQARQGTAPTLEARSGSQRGHGDFSGGLIAAAENPEIAHALTCHQVKGGDPTTDNYVAHSLRAEGFDASEDGTGRGTPLVAVEPQTFDWMAGGGGNDKSFRGASRSYTVDKPGRTRALTASKTLAVFSVGLGSDPLFASDKAQPITTRNGDPGCIALNIRQDPINGEVSPALGRKDEGHGILSGRSAIRRLTPRECERLQGFPDDYTLIPWRGSAGDGLSFEEALRRAGAALREPAGRECPDGPRYKALGNSMAVPVMRWIGQRISAVEAVLGGRTP